MESFFIFVGLSIENYTIKILYARKYSVFLLAILRELVYNKKEE